MNSGERHPRVSVVIPLYNMGAYLAESLNTVLAQSFQDWEAWVVDDGSKDDGPAIAKRYAAAHPARIHCLEHEGRQNRGVSASRNLALQHCRGELVAFLDADDLWEPDKLEAQVRVFDAHADVGLVYSSAIPIVADGSVWSPSSGVEPPVRILFDGSGQPRVGYGPPDQPVQLFEELVRHCCLVNSAVAVRRSVLEKAGRFDETMRYGEDWLLYTCVAYHCLSYFVDRPLARYRIHAQHFSASLVGNELARLRGSATFLRRLPSHLGLNDPRLRKLVTENERHLFGRVLTLAEKAWSEGRRREALALIGFGWSEFPSLVLSRRSARLCRDLLFAAKG